MRFANPTLATRWLNSGYEFRQPDFLSQTDIIIVPLLKSDMSAKGKLEHLRWIN